ncbi:TetR/AcrR family transcriptional regulator [Actibacterium sp. 188UL27-1]|uniref:TetR/AcrR family transcriptional regulator n=1 Tax=Actibacterium sp. 188UL27-1 TaxID=2786961 RepID=UPI00195A71F0|nr:TetR/AcrR family transcriptional regulator [Actibacterium sp. 188UL27-1]MBM7069715.1 TetR/AcrR family transcriptional regulator [Actibacterium sp. 188UL27-1]
MTNTAPTRKRRKDDRPGEIITAAFREFDEKGFGRSTMAGIAERAGISRTTIYLYYDTKEAIFEAAIRGSVEVTIDIVAGMAKDANGDFRTVFARAIDLIYARLVSDEGGVILKTLVAEGSAMPDLILFYRQEILSKGEAAIRALIERGIINGELSVACRGDDVRVFVAPAIFAALWLRIFHKIDPLDINAFKEAHVRLVTDGLLARP